MSTDEPRLSCRPDGVGVEFSLGEWICSFAMLDVIGDHGEFYGHFLFFCVCVFFVDTLLMKWLGMAGAGQGAGWAARLGGVQVPPGTTAAARMQPQPGSAAAAAAANWQQMRAQVGYRVEGLSKNGVDVESTGSRGRSFRWIGGIVF